MRWFDQRWTFENIAGWLRRQAALGIYDGIADGRGRAYCEACTAAHRPSGSIMILTRDAGHHTSGWWKNPDYERCWHLSLSFRDPKTGTCRPKDKELTELWIEAVYGPVKNFIWAEPPYYPEGKRTDCWHYRVFYSPGWEAPLIPRGEVYSRELTEAGWLSYSDLREKVRKENEAMA